MGMGCDARVGRHFSKMINNGMRIVFVLLLVGWPSNGLVRAMTDPSDVEALMQVKAAMDPKTIEEASCMGTWDFSLDPCDNRFGAMFSCGFDCEEDTRGVQRVTSLKLDSAGYRGPLSPFVGNLTALQFLQVSGNGVWGSIPGSLAHLTHLTILDLSSNSLAGNIPDSLGSLRSLQNLNLANNFLQGPIPVSFENLVSLSELRMENNKLSGSLPDISALQQLRFLDVSNNALSGGVPLELPPSVFSLSLKNNQLTGGLPRNFNGLQMLNVLDLSGNRLTGPIDTSLFEHPALQQLNLSNNKLTSISTPAGSSALSQIVEIDLSYNQISGTLPVHFATMKQLSALSLRYNSFTGMIPLRYALKAAAGLVGMEPLERLFLDGNYLTGPLPAPFMKLLPGNFVASFVNNCLQSCPATFFFCQGGNQKSESICRLFNAIP